MNDSVRKAPGYADDAVVRPTDRCIARLTLHADRPEVPPFAALNATKNREHRLVPATVSEDFEAAAAAGKESVMPKYIIEREIPQAGSLTPGELQSISQKSCGILQGMGPKIQWVQSYVTPDKIYCVYIAPDEDAVREHARQGGFPANAVVEIRSVIDPTTAE